MVSSEVDWWYSNTTLSSSVLVGLLRSQVGLSSALVGLFSGTVGVTRESIDVASWVSWVTKESSNCLMVYFLESSGLVGLSSRLVMVLKSSTGCVSMVDNQ